MSLNYFTTVLHLIVVVCVFASHVKIIQCQSLAGTVNSNVGAIHPGVWNGQSARKQLAPTPKNVSPSMTSTRDWPNLIGPPLKASGLNRQSRSSGWGSPEDVRSQEWYKDMLKYSTVIQNQPKISSPRNRSPSPNRDRQCSNDYETKYYSLALQWPPGYCTTSPEKCLKEPEDFTIHGMWATKGNQQGRDVSPEFCCFDNVFNINALTPIRNDLDDYWPSLFGSSQGFWKHEWLKHGTCARDTPKLRGEYNFFASTLAISKSLALKSRLASSGITPSSSKLYFVSELRAAVMNQTNNKQVRFVCEKQHNSNIPLLSGIFICYDTQLRFVDCPTWAGRCGNSKVMLPQSSQSNRMRSIG